jgi:trimeric autotransporter adhesin
VKHVKFHLNRFLRRVRIHGGEFDTSARAMYREGVTSSLRADLRIVRGSTIERKQMSTKTTFKRVALVTVAALGFGVMSVVPSTAATSADTLTLSSATASMKDSETSTATTATLGFYGALASDSMSVTAYVTSSPAGSTAVPQLTLAETSNAFVDTAAMTAAQGLVGDDLAQLAYVAPSAAVKYVTAKFKINMVAVAGAFAAGVLPGTYVLTLVPAVTAGGGLKNASNATLTITVTADANSSTVATSATSILTKTTDTQTATDATVTAVNTAKTAIGDESAYIVVTLKNAAGLTTTGESYTAIVTSGPGLLGSGSWAATTPHAYATTSGGVAASARGRAITVRGSDEIAIFGDGTSGVSTIQIQSAAGVVLATETLTFFGTATTATATVAKAVIGVAAQGAAAVLVKLADSAGTNIMTPTVTFYVTSSDPTKISGTYTSQTGTYSATLGGYPITLTAVAVGTASITIGTKSSATATTGVNAAAVSVRVGGGPTALADVKVAFDKSSYLPGELATITVTPVDAAGLNLADGDTYTVFATGGIVAPAQLGTGSATITGTTTPGGGLGTASGIVTYKVYMPAYQGTFAFKYTTGTMSTTALSAVARTVSVDVMAADGGAAIAAAEEAMAAASDAFDAALTAAEAAEMAQSIAQEALDAVASLRERMDKRFDAIAKQLNKLLKKK